MTDTSLRELERRARKSGDANDWKNYFANLRIEPEHTREICYNILTENPEGAKQAALEKLVEKGGVWVDFSGSSNFIITGVRHRGPGDTIPAPYVFNWQTDALLRVSQIRERSPPFPHTQDEAIEALRNYRDPNGNTFTLPTIAEIDATVRALHTATAQYSTGDVRDAQSRIKSSFKMGFVTCDRIVTVPHLLAGSEWIDEDEEQRYMRACGRPEQYTSDSAMGGNRPLNSHDIQEYFTTDEPIDTVQQRYNDLFEETRTLFQSYQYTAPHPTQPLVMMTARDMASTRFVLSITGVAPDSRRPARLVQVKRMGEQ